jgi:hypothetical protein
VLRGLRLYIVLRTTHYYYCGKLRSTGFFLSYFCWLVLLVQLKGEDGQRPNSYAPDLGTI